MASLDSYEDKQMFLEELGLTESGVNRLIKKAYSLLNLETFITAGEMEVKAWTYQKGWKAPQCAGVIHTDFEKGFIRAEVIKYADYIQYGSEAAVREAGKLGIEGKEYVVQDGILCTLDLMCKDVKPFYNQVMLQLLNYILWNPNVEALKSGVH